MGNCKPIPCFDTSQQVYRTIESCRMKNALDCVMETTCRLNFTLWSLRLSAPRLRVAITRFAFMLRRCTKVALLANEPVAAADLHSDRDAIDLSSSEVDSTTTDEHRFSDSFPTTARRSLHAIYIDSSFPLASREEQDFTHRRRRSCRKIAYKLIAESYSACAARRSNLRRVSDNDEMNLSKRKRFEISVSAEDSKLANNLWKYTECTRSPPILISSMDVLQAHFSLTKT